MKENAGDEFIVIRPKSKLSKNMNRKNETNDSFATAHANGNEILPTVSTARGSFFGSTHFFGSSLLYSKLLRKGLLRLMRDQN